MESGRLTWKERGWLWLRLGIRLGLTALVLWMAARFGRPLFSLFAPFLAALVAASALNPLVKWVQRRMGLPRSGVTMLLLLVLFGLLGGLLVLLAYGIGSEVVDLVQNWDVLLHRLEEMMAQMEFLFARLLALAPPQITEMVQTAGDDFLAWLGQVVPTALSGLAALAGQKAMKVPSLIIAVMMFVMATYFLTADYPYLRTRAVQNMDEGVRAFLGQLRATALGAFGGYLKAQLLLTVGVFFILLAGFLITRQSYSFLLALGLAVLDFIPIVGAGTVMVPWAAIALFTGDFPMAIRLLVIWGLIAVFRRVMEPKFVGDQTGLSPIQSLVSIYVGMKLAGVPGMILGPILLLVLLNLAGMGMFRGVWRDLTAAARDLAAILAREPEAI